jgi:hypothetical protein
VAETDNLMRLPSNERAICGTVEVYDVATLGIYFIALTLASDWSFTLYQFRQFWPYVVALAAGFVSQIVFLVT